MPLAAFIVSTGLATGALGMHVMSLLFPQS
jgi:hypothetical protein